MKSNERLDLHRHPVPCATIADAMNYQRPFLVLLVANFLPLRACYALKRQFVILAACVLRLTKHATYGGVQRSVPDCWKRLALVVHA